MEFLRSFLRRHLAGKPVVVSPNARFSRLLKISHTSKLMNEFSILKRLTLPQFMFLKLFLVVPGLTYASFMTILRGFSGTGLPFVAVLSVQG